MKRQNINQILRLYTAKYIWWKTPDEALHQPERIVAQVMELGDYEDVQTMVEQLGNQYLKTVLLLEDIGSTQESYVKVSFFGHLKFGRVGEPELTEDGVLEIASF